MRFEIDVVTLGHRVANGFDAEQRFGWEYIAYLLDLVVINDWNNHGKN